MKRVHIASSPMRGLGRAHRSQKQRRPEPPRVCARQGLRPGRKDSGHLNQPREVVSTPGMVPVCDKARTGALPRRSPALTDLATPPRLVAGRESAGCTPTGFLASGYGRCRFCMGQEAHSLGHCSRIGRGSRLPHESRWRRLHSFHDDLRLLPRQLWLPLRLPSTLLRI